VKEYQIGVEVLGRPATFDPAEDAAARVEAHRLRKRLREFYETEGRSHTLRIEVPLGHYAVAFRPITAEPPTEAGQDEVRSGPVPVLENGSANGSSSEIIDPPRAGRLNFRIWWRILPLVILAGVAIAMLARHPAVSNPPAAPLSKSQIAATGEPPAAENARLTGLAAGGSVRIACGRTRTHTDRWGEAWQADRYYTGGSTFEIHRQYIARAYDPKLFQAGRTGNFTYKIPLGPGVYELHLYFIEGTFGPAMPAGGGEISRLFEVKANGETLLSRFDIYSDAGGSNIADVRVFKDISPGPDKTLTLSFQGQTGLALVNAIELVPARPHRLNPVRIVAQEGFYTDSTGAVWKPDRFYNGGQNASHSIELRGTADPELFSRERYGHFDYAIPVGKGTYRLSLYFAEEYFGPGGALGGQPGMRIFDVTCNGVALLRDFNLAKEGGLGQTVVKTFHGLIPNGQGTLLVNFSPVHDYASLYALEVVDESN